MPDANGLVQVTAPPLTLPPGTRVQIANFGSGAIGTYTAANDGSIAGDLPASTRDRLVISLTDPLGNVTTFERGQYEAADGTTAVNTAGGVIDGVGGVEVRIPQEAVLEPVIMKVEAFGPELFADPAQRPNLPDTTFAGGIKIETTGEVRLKKPATLAFDTPVGAPEGSFYYVYRRLDGPNGMVAFETLDHALPDANGKIVTHSPPFSGYTTNINGFDASGLSVGGGAGADVATGYALLMYSFDAALQAPIHGVITGKVLRQVWNPGAAAPDYVGVQNAIVSRVDEQGNPVGTTASGSNVAISQADGTFTLIDSFYTGGSIQIAAVMDGQVQRATAFDSTDPLSRQSVPEELRFYRNVATANITYPAHSDASFTIEGLT